MIPFAGIALVLAAAPADDAVDGEPLEDSGDDVGHGFGVPLVDEVHLDSYADFRELVERSDWSRAFRSIADQMQDPPAGLLPPRDGIALAFRERLWRDLVELEPDGRRAFRLFHDAPAERAWREARTATGAERRRLLSRIHERWFPTSVGDQAADALARDAMEAGDPRRAATYWRAVLDHHPDTDLDKLGLWLDLVEALAGCGSSPELARAVDHVSLRYAGRAVERGGESVPVETWLAEHARPAAAAPPERLPARLPLAQDPAAAWRMEIAPFEYEEGGFGSNQIWHHTRQGRDVPPLPATALHEAGLLVTVAGRTWLLDPADGTPVWEVGAYPGGVWPGTLQGRDVLVPAGDAYLGTANVGRNDQTVVLNLRLVDPGPGRERWSTDAWSAEDEVTFLGRPVVRGDAVFVVSQRVGSFHLELWRASLDSGEVRWRVPIGTSPATKDASNPWGWGGMSTLLPIQPWLAADGDELYVMTDCAAVLALAPADGRILWAWIRPLGRAAPIGASPASALVDDGVLYLRSLGLGRCVALDLVERRELWSTAVGEDERVVAVDDEWVLLLGSNLRALDRRTGERIWSRPVMVPREARHLVTTEAHVYVLTRRGLYEIEKATGDSGRRPMRGELTALGGGDVHFDGERVLCVGREAVVAVELEH